MVPFASFEREWPEVESVSLEAGNGTRLKPFVGGHPRLLNWVPACNHQIGELHQEVHQCLHRRPTPPP